jgi:hypothetical protein
MSLISFLFSSASSALNSLTVIDRSFLSIFDYANTPPSSTLTSMKNGFLIPRLIIFFNYDVTVAENNPVLLYLGIVLIM